MVQKYTKCRAIFSLFYNILQPNFAILLILMFFVAVVMDFILLAYIKI